MSALVVDASVAFKWYFDEPWSEVARQLLSGERRLVVPHLFFTETSNVLRKRCERKELSLDGVWATVGSLDRLPLESWPDRPLLRPALRIALDCRLSVNDAVYVALADQVDGRVVTADRRLANALAGKGLAARVVWIEDVAPT